MGLLARMRRVKRITRNSNLNISKFVLSPGIYRIYSRISREILDKIWQIFLQFDLYAGQKIGSGKHAFIHYLCVLRPSKPLKKENKKMKFWSFFSTYFSNSTYTRVDLYASIYGNYLPVKGIVYVQTACFKLAQSLNYNTF